MLTFQQSPRTFMIYVCRFTETFLRTFLWNFPVFCHGLNSIDERVLLINLRIIAANFWKADLGLNKSREVSQLNKNWD